MSSTPSPKGNWLITAFISLNLFTILFTNLPYSYQHLGGRPSIPHAVTVPAELFARQIRVYGYLTGLDAQWKMFSHPNRYNWWYLIKAQYPDARTVILPLERQSPRSIWERVFFDFKVAKFHWNISASKESRRAYALFLCRQYAHLENEAIQSIVFEYQSQQTLSPEEALIKGEHLSSKVESSVSDIFPCAAKE